MTEETKNAVRKTKTRARKTTKAAAPKVEVKFEAAEESPSEQPAEPSRDIVAEFEAEISKYVAPPEWQRRAKDCLRKVMGC